jgi:hypothetical protein
MKVNQNSLILAVSFTFAGNQKSGSENFNFWFCKAAEDAVFSHRDLLKRHGQEKRRGYTGNF